MGYVKTDWEAGDLITAPKLNKIEDALGDMIPQDAYVEETWTFVLSDNTTVTRTVLVKVEQ